MNILYIWDADYPWDVRVEKMCNGLHNIGYNVHIAARNLKNRKEFEKIDGINIHRLTAFKNNILNYFLSFPAFFNPVWLSFLSAIIKKNNINVVIVRDLPMLTAGVWLGKLYNIPVIFDMAEDYIAMLNDIWIGRKFDGFNLIVRNPYLARIVEKYCLKNTDHNLVVIDEAKKLLVSKGVSPDKITIISNTPSIDILNKPVNNLSDELLRIRERYLIVYTGGIQIGRGIQTVIESLKYIVPVIKDLLFVIVGSGYATERLQSLAAREKVEKYILWTGQVEHSEVYNYIFSSRIGIIPHFVSPHTNTTIPNKIFDYMGMGKPVVASDAVPLKRILEKENAGMTFKSGDASSCAEAILHVYNSKIDYGKNGRNAILKKYYWEKDLERLIYLINYYQ